MWQRSIAEEGFAVIPSLLGRADILSVVEGFRGMPRRGRAGVRHALKIPAVADLAYDPRLLGMAKEILGNEALPFRATLFDKSRDANWLVVWHQDTALPIRTKPEAPDWGPWSVKDGIVYAHAPAAALTGVLALRVHLDDSTKENGPLRVLPGTHTLGVLSDDAIREISTRGSPVEGLVPSGGILAMRPLVVHSSSKSRAENPRRVVHIEYAASAFLADGLELAVA